MKARKTRMMLGCGASFLGPSLDLLFRQTEQQMGPASETSAGQMSQGHRNRHPFTQLPVSTAGLPCSRYCAVWGNPNRGDFSHPMAPLVHTLAHLSVSQCRTQWLRGPGSCHTQCSELRAEREMWTKRGMLCARRRVHTKHYSCAQPHRPQQR